MINASDEMKERLGNIGKEVAESVLCTDDGVIGSMTSFLDEDYEYLSPDKKVRSYENMFVPLNLNYFVSICF
jgi:hypothetical protein